MASAERDSRSGADDRLAEISWSGGATLDIGLPDVIVWEFIRPLEVEVDCWLGNVEDAASLDVSPGRGGVSDAGLGLELDPAEELGPDPDSVEPGAVGMELIWVDGEFCPVELGIIFVEPDWVLDEAPVGELADTTGAEDAPDAVLSVDAPTEELGLDPVEPGTTGVGLG